VDGGDLIDYAFGARVLRLWDFAEPDPAHRQSLLTQVARTHGLQEDFATGHTTLDSLGDPADLADEPGVRALLERGRLHNSAGAPETAVPLFRAAYNRATAAGLDGLAGDAAHMMAIALPKEEHEEWTRRGLAVVEGSADPLAPGMEGALLNNLGWTYADDDRWAEALELFERAVDARRRSGNPKTLHIARWTRARALRALGRREEALAELRELAAMPEGADDPYVAEEIAANS
jgi:tetratricopeptide (TPR) repeat protein